MLEKGSIEMDRNGNHTFSVSFSNIYTYSIYVKKHVIEEIDTKMITVIENEQYALYFEMIKNDNKLVQDMKKLALKNLSHSKRFNELADGIDFSGKATKKIELRPEIFLAIWIMLSSSHLFRGDRNDVAQLMNRYAPLNEENKENNYQTFNLHQLSEMGKVAPKELSEQEKEKIEKINIYLHSIVDEFVAKPGALLEAFKGTEFFLCSKEGKDNSPLSYIERLEKKVTSLSSIDEFEQTSKASTNKPSSFHEMLTSKIKSGWFSTEEVVNNLRVIFTEIFLLPSEIDYGNLVLSVETDINNLLNTVKSELSISEYNNLEYTEQNRAYEEMRQLQLTLKNIKKEKWSYFFKK